MDKLRELIFTALGAASVCWKGDTTPEGAFDSERATEIGEQLIKDLLWALEAPLEPETRLEDKILSGYTYTIQSLGPVANDRSLIMSTGQGGALNWIKTCREQGWNDSLISSSITVNLNGAEYGLHQLTLKQND